MGKPICLYIAMGLSAAGCTAQHIYGSGQAWQREQCYRMPDQNEGKACLDKANQSYDSYTYEKAHGNK